VTSPFEVVVLSSDWALRHHLAGILAKLGVEPVPVSTLRECHEILAQKKGRACVLRLPRPRWELSGPSSRLSPVE
jgi:hypothetical protein